MGGKAIRRLVDQGVLPHFSALLEAGASGDLAPGSPSAMAGWVSLATGLPAHRHGITRPHLPRADGRGVAPARLAHWQAEPFWRALEATGRRVALINLPATAPATDNRVSFAVDPRFFSMPATGSHDWPLARHSVHPADRRDRLRGLRVHLAQFADLDLGGLPKEALAEAGAIQAATLHALTQERAEIVIVSHPLAARAPGDAALRFLDRAIATLLDAAGPDTELLIASPGGLLLMVGTGFAPDTLIHGAQPSDIAATVLARHGLPVPGGRPLDGTVAQSIAPPSPVPIWRPDPAAPEPVRIVERENTQGIAMAAMNQSEHAYARRQLQAIVEDAPGHPRALPLLGQCCFFLQDWPACLDIGEALAQTSSDEPWGAMIHGAGLLMTGEHAQARPLLERAAERSADNPFALCKLGALWMHAREPQTALGLYRAALAPRPVDPDALAGIGMASLATDRLAHGERYLKASLAQRFHAPAIHEQLALLYDHLGRPEEAERERRIAGAQSGDAARPA